MSLREPRLPVNVYIGTRSYYIDVYTHTHTTRCCCCCCCIDPKQVHVLAMSVKYLIGDIIEEFRNDATSLIILQSNCVAMSARPGSFEESIFKNFPYADIYRLRRKHHAYTNLAAEMSRSSVGMIDIKKPPSGWLGPVIGCLYGQFKMGAPDSSYYLKAAEIEHSYVEVATRYDTVKDRCAYFQRGVSRLGTSLKEDLGFIKKVIFPSHIGCTSAGGDWCAYLEIIQKFAVGNIGKETMVISYNAVELAIAASQKHPRYKCQIIKRRGREEEEEEEENKKKKIPRN